MPDYMSDAGLLEHLRKQKLNIAEYKTDVSADAADQQSIAEDCDNMQAIIEFCPLAEEYKTGAFGIKRVLIRGNPEDEIGTLMSAPVFAPPFPLAAGIEKRSRERDGRFKRSKTITQAALDALDLSSETPDNLMPGDQKPTGKFEEAQNGYLFAAVVGNRGKSDSWEIQIQRAGEEKWTVEKTATGKSCDVEIFPTLDGKPEKLRVRIQLRKNNQNYGQPSDIVEVTVKP